MKILSPDRRIESARSQWRYRGQERPEFAVVPGAGQASVWDYPRPPRIEAVNHPLKVMNGDTVVAETTLGKRVVETAGAPTYYFPPDDVHAELIVQTERSMCEWKGIAQALTVDGRDNAAWRYIEMFPEFVELYLWVAFYPAELSCYVGEEQVRSQPGGY